MLTKNPHIKYIKMHFKLKSKNLIDNFSVTPEGLLFLVTMLLASCPQTESPYIADG